MHKQGNSVTSRIDFNTVGPVSTASGYGSSMLTNSAVYVLDNCNEIKGYTDSDSTELSHPGGVANNPSFTDSRPTRGSNAEMSVMKMASFTVYF